MFCPKCAYLAPVAPKHHDLVKTPNQRTCSKGLGLLPVSQRAAVDAYVSEVEQVAAQLRSFAYRAQGPGLVGGDGIAAAADSQTWTQKKIRVSARGKGSFLVRLSMT